MQCVDSEILFVLSNCVAMGVYPGAREYRGVLRGSANRLRRQSRLPNPLSLPERLPCQWTRIEDGPSTVTDATLESSLCITFYLDEQHKPPQLKKNEKKGLPP